MCLKTIDREETLTEDITAYKVVVSFGSGFKHSVIMGYKFKPGTNIAESTEEISINSDTSYSSGFHCLLRYRDAEKLKKAYIGCDCGWFKIIKVTIPAGTKVTFGKEHNPHTDFLPGTDAVVSPTIYVEASELS